jgi:NUDIX domain
VWRELSGGDFEDGETYLEAAIRELRERRVDVENDPSLHVSTPEINAPLVEMGRSGISEIP